MSPIDLLPPPRRLVSKPGQCASQRRIRRIMKPIARPEPEAYRLTIANAGITLQSGSEQGLFYAEQTLAQLITQSPKALPCLEITDWPAYPVRGFYHDVSRGKVPTLKTLIELAETCARYKLNQLQLYIEHTYAYREHPVVWRGADPLTADEIRTLDARCAQLNIDLVPSFSTFGHFYTWIHHKFPELNELERDVSAEPFCWWDRMMHYTLDCRNPRSIALVRDIIREVRPLFRSKFFNICADETFDLGKGRNQAAAAKLGAGRLYVDFLKKIMAAVKQAGAIPMFWGDIIGKHPELLEELPRNAIALDWDYDPELQHSKAPLLQRTGRSYFICPGVNGWNMWLPHYAKAHRNITRFARFGFRHGASGLLNTDWGDYGHINTLGPTLPGMVLGASAGWNPASPTLAEGRFEPAVSRQILGDPSGRLLGLLRRASSSQRSSWSMVCLSIQPRSKDFPENWFDRKTGLPDGLFKDSARTHRRALASIQSHASEALKLLPRCQPKDRLLKDEIRLGLLGLEVMEEFHLVAYHRAGKIRACPVQPKAVARRLRELDRGLARVWLRRNKPSELQRVRDVLQGAASLVLSPSS